VRKCAGSGVPGARADTAACTRYVGRWCAIQAREREAREQAGPATRAPAPGSAATATWGSGYHAPRMLVLGAEEAREAARNAARFTAAACSSAVGASLCKVTGARSRAAAAAAGGGMGMPSCVARVAVSYAVPLSCKPLPVPQTGSPRWGRWATAGSDDHVCHV